MADNQYNSGTNATVGENTVVHFYDRAGVKAANRVNLYGQFADRKSMPKKMGKTFKISKFLHMYDRPFSDGDFGAKGFLSARDIADITTNLDTAASLAEGAGAVNKRTLTKVTMETTLARYGEMLDYTDEVELFSEDAMQVRYREELGELANSRMEDLIQRDMLSTTTVMYGGAATAINEISDDSVVTYDLIRKGVRKLVRNRAKKNTYIVTGSTKIGTTPIAKAYYAIIGANVKGDLENLTRGSGTQAEEYVYIPVHKYAAAGSMAEGEVGAMHEVRFIESEAAVVYGEAGGLVSAGGDTSNTKGLSVTNLNYDVFPILFPTEGSFATVGLKGQGKIKFNAKSPAKVENSNPYGTTGFFSYNFFYAGIILEEEKLLKLLVSASA